MISILIPTYNCSVVTLVKTLYSQVISTEIPFEILVCDDASSNLGIVQENQSIDKFEHCTLLINSSNVGRTQTRQKLAETAKYNWLLFLDADVAPKYDTFIEKYLKSISTKTTLIFGGICYEKQKPKEDKTLRWKYGKTREEIPLAKRKKNPVTTINSGCFLINKQLFLPINKKMNYSGYGMDLLFQYLLIEHKNAILHIDNPVFHLGLESNSDFIKKSLKAVETTFFLEKEIPMNIPIKPLQKTYLKLKNNHLLGVFEYSFKPFKNRVKKNLLSNNPSLLLFDLFRLNYYIQVKKNA